MRPVVLVLLFTAATVVHPAPIVVDHGAVDASRGIPQAYLDQAKAMWIDVPGESHSSGYRIGARLLQDLDARFAVSAQESGTPEGPTTLHLRLNRATWGDISNATGWRYGYGEEDWYTTPAAVQRTKDHVTYASSHGLPIAAIGFGWCWDMTWHNGPGGTVDPVHQVRWAGSSVGGPDGDLRWGLDAEDVDLTGNHVSMDTYLDSVEQLIAHCAASGYATRPFFTTGPVDGGGNVGESGYQRQLKHERIRGHVAGSGDRVLFDYADILSWSDAGVQSTTTWTDHGGTPRTFPTIHAENMADLDGVPFVADDGDHIGKRGALRLGRAVWYLAARLAGWDGTPEVVLTVDDVVRNEASSPPALLFTVTLTGTPGGTVTVDYSTADGTAVAGSDYTSVSGTLAFAPGASKQSVSVPILDDTEDEADETLFLDLSNGSGAQVADGQARGLVVDDDNPTLAIDDVFVVEGDSATRSVAFAVSMNRTTTQPVSVNWATAAGTATSNVDYPYRSGTLSIPAGDLGGTVTVLVNGDSTAEPDETFFVRLSNAGNASIADGQGTATILDDDTAGDVGTDFDADGKADLFWRHATTGEDAVWLMDGAATRAGAPLSTVASPWRIADAGDLDGDGRADVIWRNGSTGEGAVWFMSGTAVASAGWLAPVSPPWDIARAGDFDGDGRADLLWTNPTTGQTAVWLMNGTTAASAALLAVVGAGWEVGGVGDVSGDGKTDVLWFDPASGQTALWLMNGAAIGSGAYGPSVPAGWAPAGMGDLDGNGKADVVWREASTGGDAVWFLDGAAVASAAVLPTVGTPWTVAGVGDLDGDVKADVLWRNGSTGENAVWFMDGETVASSGFATAVTDTAWTIDLP